MYTYRKLYISKIKLQKDVIKINNLKLRDYPCLYYLSDRLSEQVQCNFLCGLATIFSLTIKEISASSILFAHASNGVLYNGLGFSEEEIEVYGGDTLKKPFTSCKSLWKWNILKNIKLKDECCVICPLSPTFLNARIDSERMCLRSTIHTGKLIALESERFISVVPIAAGNDISEYPVIPFYKYLNQYFIDNDPHGPYNKVDLQNEFHNFLCKKLQYEDKKSTEIVLECVKRELSILFDFNFEKISSNEVNVCYLELLAPYNYDPPKFMRTSSNEHPDNLPSARPKAKKRKNITQDEINFGPIFIAAAEAIDNSNEKSLSEQINDSSMESTYTEQSEQIVTEQSENIVSFDKFKYDNSWLNNYQSLLNPNKNRDTLSYDFINNYIDFCDSDNPAVLIRFLTEICSSRFVAIECVTINNDKGLLFMTTSKRFYFFNIKYNTAGYLYPALCDATKLKFLSLDPLPVISTFYKLGFKKIIVESLPGLYCLYKSISYISNYADMFNNILEVSNFKELDFYHFYMPLYEEFYLSLINNLPELVEQQYNRGLNLDVVLGYSYDLSDIIYGLYNSIEGTGFVNYKFLYNKESSFIKPGILYVVNIPTLKEEDPIKTKHFFEEVAIAVHLSPFRYISYTKLLSILDTGIAYFSIKDGDMFFDILLNVVRKHYKKIYNNMPVLRTYRIEYTE